MDEQGMLEGTQNKNSASQPLLMDEDSLHSRESISTPPALFNLHIS